MEINRMRQVIQAAAHLAPLFPRFTYMDAKI